VLFSRLQERSDRPAPCSNRLRAMIALLPQMGSGGKMAQRGQATEYRRWEPRVLRQMTASAATVPQTRDFFATTRTTLSILTKSNPVRGVGATHVLQVIFANRATTKRRSMGE
jgi:hypothetical protein